MNKSGNKKPKPSHQPKNSLEESKAYLPNTPMENPDPEEEAQGLPAINPKDWKKFIGCGG